MSKWGICPPQKNEENFSFKFSSLKTLSNEITQNCKIAIFLSEPNSITNLLKY